MTLTYRDNTDRVRKTPWEDDWSIERDGILL